MTRLYLEVSQFDNTSICMENDFVRYHFVSLTWRLRFALILSISSVVGIALALGIAPRWIMPSSLILIGSTIWAWLELRKEHLRPNIPWYQGALRPLPHLECRFQLNQQECKARVGYLDARGTYILPIDDTPIKKLGWTSSQKTKLVLSFRDRELVCYGVPVTKSLTLKGIGFEFVRMPADLRKDLGDMIELLKGGGYVSK